MQLSNRNELIIQRIFTEILHGEKGADGKMPPALELAKEYEISTASVREALRFLESIGILSLSHGRGIFVQHRKEIITDLIVARKVIERNNAREAAANRTEEGIGTLTSILKRMDSAIEDEHIELYSQLDLELHLFLSELSENMILKQMLENIRLLMYRQLMEVNSLPPLLKESHAKHHSLVAAIIEQDLDNAEKVMSEHLDQVNHYWKNSIL